jgi:hypothetical protein
VSNLRQLPEDVRYQILGVVERANNDAEFSQRLSNDPMGTLTEAGLATSTAQAVIDYNPTEDMAEVEGYRSCADGTCWFIDWSSVCPGTCFLSF